MFHRCDHSRCDKTIEVLRGIIEDQRKQISERDKLLVDMHGEGAENESRRLQAETYGRLQALNLEYQIKGAKPPAPSETTAGKPSRPEHRAPLDDETPPPASERLHVLGKTGE